MGYERLGDAERYWHRLSPVELEAQLICCFPITLPASPTSSLSPRAKSCFPSPQSILVFVAE